MAIADKLVNLADLKVAYDDNAGKIIELKSAFDYVNITEKLFGVENLLDNVTRNSETQRGISYTHVGGGIYHVKGSVLSGQTYSQVTIYEGSTSGFLTAGETYLIQNATGDSHVLLRIYAYNSSNAATDIYNSTQGPQMVTIPADTVKVLLRLRVEGSGTSVDCCCYPAITKTLSNSQLSELINGSSTGIKALNEGIASLKTIQKLYGLDNLLDNLQYVTKTINGVDFIPEGDGIFVHGTATAAVNNGLYDGVVPAWLEKGREYRCVFEHDDIAIKMLIYGYDSENAATVLFDSSNGDDGFTIPESAVKILIRLRVENGATVDGIVYPAISAQYTNEQLHDEVDTITEALRETQNLFENFAIVTKTVNGVTFEKSGDGVFIHGTAIANVNQSIYDGTVPDWLEKEEEYKVQFEHDNSTIKLLIYGYDSNDTAYSVYDSSVGSRAFTIASNIVRILVRLHVDNGQTVNEIVYPVISKQYTNKQLGEMLTSIEASVPVVTKYMYYSGRLFITLCGDKIYIDAQAFRLYDRNAGTYTPSGNTGTTILNYVSNNANYIHCDSNGVFTRSPYFSDDVIATVDQAFVNGIIFGYRKIQNGYIRSGSEFFLNFERTPINAYAVYSGSDVKLSKQGYAFSSAKTVTYQIDGYGSTTFTIEQNTTNIANKKILIIGDSFVARGYIQNFLTQMEPTLSFIGTKTTQNYDFKSEGISGSRLYAFTEESTSPFWFNGGLNFGTYLSSNNQSRPDFVVINSAINHNNYSDSTHGTYLQNLTDLVNMVKTYDSTIKVYVTFGANYAMGPGSVYGYPSATRYNEIRRCCNSVYEVQGITIIPVDSALIDELDYTYQDYEYQSSGNNIKVLADCVHPAEGTGFKKIAKMIYNYLGI